VHLVGFIIRIYHDARSPERQIYRNVFENRKNETFFKFVSNTFFIFLLTVLTLKIHETL